jgi:hypothetical protein
MTLGMFEQIIAVTFRGIMSPARKVRGAGALAQHATEGNAGHRPAFLDIPCDERLA